MAVTKITDVITNPDLFSDYVINRTMELSALYQSGIVRDNAQFDELANSVGTVFHMPFWEDLADDAQDITEDGNFDANKITASQDKATTILRGQMWGANNLAAAMAGDDPMRAVAELVAAYWARQMQKETIAILTGVFGTTDDATPATPMADHIKDLTGLSGNAKKISASAFIDALQLLGDAQNGLTAVVMDSATKSYLKKQNLIETHMDSGSVEFDTYQDRRVIVDDGCPTENSGATHNLYIFGEGAFALGNGHPEGIVLTETDRDKKSRAGIDYLINRRAFILHPRGVAWQNAVRANVYTVSRAELANAKNWSPVFEPKNIRIVNMKYEIG